MPGDEWGSDPADDLPGGDDHPDGTTGPPVDRTWRHPSEMRGAGAGPPSLPVPSPPLLPAPTANAPGAPAPRGLRIRGAGSLLIGLTLTCAVLALLLVAERAPDPDDVRVRVDASLANGSTRPTVNENGRGGWLGVDGRPVAKNNTTMVQLTSVVDGGPADQAGLRPGDLLCKVDSREVTDMAVVRATLHSAQAGTTVAVTIWRGNRERTVNVILAERPSA